MAQFTTRVELHGANSEDYDKLHDKMRENGFYLAIVGGSGDTFMLPSAEYDSAHNLSCSQVRDLAKSIADSIKSGAWILVTQVADRAWNLKVIRKKAA